VEISHEGDSSVQPLASVCLSCCKTQGHCAVVGELCTEMCCNPNMISIRQPLYSHHLAVTLIFKNFTPGTSSYNVCTALTLISIWPWGSEVIIQLSLITVRWLQLAMRHCQWWLHSVSPPCCCAWDLPSLQTVCTACLCSVHINDTRCSHTTDNTGETVIMVIIKMRRLTLDCQVCTVLQNVSTGESRCLWLNGASKTPQ
jgi:hypothetical protein